MSVWVMVTPLGITMTQTDINTSDITMTQTDITDKNFMEKYTEPFKSILIRWFWCAGLKIGNKLSFLPYKLYMVLDHCDLFYIIQGVWFNGQKFCGKGLSNIFAVTLFAASPLY